MNLKVLRLTEQKNQTEIAQFLNVTQQTYARYELETSEPTIETLCKLADYYNVSLDYLVGREYANDAGYLTDDERELLNNFRLLNKKNKDIVRYEVQGILVVQNHG